MHDLRCGFGRDGLPAQQLLNAADGITFLMQKAVDAPCKLDVIGPIITAVARPPHRPQPRGIGFPKKQEGLGYAGLQRQVTDGF